MMHILWVICQVLFYIWALPALYYEVWKIFNYDKINSISIKLDNVIETKIVDDLTEKEMILILASLLYIIWTFVGLFTCRGWLFLFLIILSLLEYVWPFWKTKWGFRVDSVISIIIILSILINKF